MRSILFLLPVCLLAPVSLAEQYAFQEGPRLPRVVAASAVAELADGGAVTAGGFYGSFPTFAIGEVLRYQPGTGTWVNGGTLSVARGFATATRLGSGQVLIVGGATANGPTVANVDRFDPATNTCLPALPLQEARQSHSATLLADGRLLVLGGTLNGSSALPSGEIFQPQSGTWTGTAPMPHARAGHAAVLLLDGRVLVFGGRGSSGSNVTEVDIYQPATDSWAPALPLTQGSSSFGVLLADGRVLSVNGNSNSACEIFDPATGLWTATAPVGVDQAIGAVHRLPSGRVLAVAQTYARVFDPTTGDWTNFGLLQVDRSTYGSTLLTDGRVLLVGGSNFTVAQSTLDSTEILAPLIGAWSPAPALGLARRGHTATLLSDGRVLAVGGHAGSETTSCEIFDPATGIWSPTGALTAARGFHTAALLPDGKVLVAGGRTVGGTYLNSAEVYDPATGGWHSVGNLSQARSTMSQVALPNGNILFCGGSNGGLSNVAEVYQPGTETFLPANPMNQGRLLPVMGRLPDGKVLVAAGDYGNPASSEIYDPETNAFTPAGPLQQSHDAGNGSQLPSGKILLFGGYEPSGRTATTELYDPATGVWTSVTRHLSTLVERSVRLADGRLLASGGYIQLAKSSNYGVSAASRVFDPGQERWIEGAAMLTPRAFHQLVLLPDGRVLAIGGNQVDGQGNPISLASCEFFTPSVQAAAPVIGAIQQQPGGLQLTWQGAGANRAFRVEFAPSPAAPWQAFPGFQSSNAAGQLSFLDAQPAPTARFYRTVLLP